MGRQNKKCSYDRKSGERKNNATTDKEEEKKLAGPLAKMKPPPEGCSRTGMAKKPIEIYLSIAIFYCRGERGYPTRKANAAHIVSHELETLRFVSLLLPLCVSVPKLYSISREA